MKLFHPSPRLRMKEEKRKMKKLLKRKRKRQIQETNRTSRQNRCKNPTTMTKVDVCIHEILTRWVRRSVSNVTGDHVDYLEN